MQQMPHHLICAAFAATLWAAPAAYADEAVLYADPAPADAVFVRILSGATEATFRGVTLSPDAADPNAYIAVSAADLHGVPAGGYYSIAAGPNGPLTVEEPARETAAKVHLVLVNTGPDAVRLIVPGKGMEVVAALEPGQAASRAVNPISTPLAVERTRDGAILGHFEVTLSRGQNLTFHAGAERAQLIENSFGPVWSAN